jgi:hypothetical protein
MDHIIHMLASHWHLSASQYWQLRLLCAVSLVPLLGVLCLIVATSRKVPAGFSVTRIKRRIKASYHPTLSNSRANTLLASRH